MVQQNLLQIRTWKTCAYTGGLDALYDLSYFGRLFEDILDPNRKSGIG